MGESRPPIPEPPTLPFLGNLTLLDQQYPLGSMVNLADQYGEIYRLHFPTHSTTIISTHALAKEIYDEKRFPKIVDAILGQVRNGVHDGLFTANSDEPNWGIAHRVLMPAFGPMSIRGMFDEMHDIASQLAMKWARHGTETPIMVTDDFTRLTLDTLAICAMGYRFNSYYHDEMHPFISAMGDFLTESGNRSRRVPYTSLFYRSVDQKYWDDVKVLRETADGVLEARKKNPSDRKDLLTAMLNGTDPKTGQHMTDTSITDNLITFLIAGHETTSGLLSFAFYYLLKSPAAYRKAQDEVDQVIGTGQINVDHLNKLPYITAVLRETLRVSATIPVTVRTSAVDTLLGDKYPVRKGDRIAVLLSKMHTDPKVYGEDANEFKPERMLDEPFERRNKEFPNCWKPFGDGMRGCIGRPFAWQESLLVMAMLLQSFNFMYDDPSYQLGIKQTLTIKPKEFYMRATLRDGLTATQLEHRLTGTSAPANGDGANGHAANGGRAPGIKLDGHSSIAAKPQALKGKPMAIYYGSNSGTCESMARRLAADAASHGFAATTVDALDAANQALPTDHPLVVITASYEGQAPDNAAHFVAWLESMKEKKLEDRSYAVFGCGHHDWSQTFHRIPKLVDSRMSELGATRIAPLGLADAASGDMFTEFETWEDEVLWPAMKKKYGMKDVAEGETVESSITVEVTNPRSSALRQDVREAVVLDTYDLTAPDAPTKKHMEIQLPTGMTYDTGDYLALLPLNPKANIDRAMRRFELAWDANITITASGRTVLPTNVPVSAYDVLRAYVELAQPATKRNVLALAEATQDENTKKQLKALADESYAKEVSEKKTSVLDLLERFPSVALPFGSFLAMLPPMRVRQYSISSSPLWNPNNVTLTYAVLDAPSLSGTGRHQGVASSYLSSLARGDKLHVSVRPSHAAFHLPATPESTPVIMVGCGAGLAPLRGFVQERAAQMGAGRALAPALLYFGCRHPHRDDLYREELARWEAMGAVSVRRAYSRAPERSGGCAHVQDRIWEDRDEIDELWLRGAKVFVCGSRGVGQSVKETVLKMAEAKARERGRERGAEDLTRWFESIRNERYATDVFD